MHVLSFLLVNVASVIFGLLLIPSVISYLGQCENPDGSYGTKELPDIETPLMCYHCGSNLTDGDEAVAACRSNDTNLLARFQKPCRYGSAKTALCQRRFVRSSTWGGYTIIRDCIMRSWKAKVGCMSNSIAGWTCTCDKDLCNNGVWESDFVVNNSARKTWKRPIEMEPVSKPIQQPDYLRKSRP